MLIALVYAKVKPEYINPFIEATKENARNSNKEPGVARFDFLQQQDDPTHFTLIEVFKTPEAQAKHRETAHYLKWRDAVVEMMAEPRTSTKYNLLYPEDQVF